LLFFGVLFGLRSQSAPSFFHHLTPAQGLSQVNNAYVYHDSRGFVWVSSIDGLNRFDGLTVRVYRPNSNNPRSMRGQNVISPIFEDPNGDLWFCTYEAINCYRRKSDDFDNWQLVHPGSGDTIREDYYAFHLDPSGQLWLRLGDGDNGRLFYFNIYSGRAASPSGTLLGNRCYAAVAANGAVRAVYSFFFRDNTRPGLNCLSISEGKTTQFKRYFDGDKQPSRWFCDIYIEKDSVLWLGGEAGLTRFEPQKEQWKTYPIPESPTAMVSAVEPLDANQLALATAGAGLYFFDRHTPGRYVEYVRASPARAASLSSDKLFDLHLDASRNLWISDWVTGVNFTNFDKPKVHTIALADLETPHRPESNMLRAMEEDAHGRIWCATRDGGIYIFERHKLVRQIYNQNGLPKANIRFLYRDDSDIMWAVSSKGLFWYDENSDRFRLVDGTLDLFQNDNACVRQLKSGQRLLAHYGFRQIIPLPDKKGFRLSDKKWPLHPHLDSAYIYYFHVDDEGTFYCNANAGQTVIVRRDGSLHTLPLNNLKSCHVAKDGANIWLATTYGLANVRWNGVKYDMKLYDESNLLPNQYLYCVLPDSSGRLWMSSNNGILRFDPLKKEVRQLGAADGVWANEFFTNVWLKTASGEIWMGNRDVLNWFNPDRMKDLSTMAKPQITQLKVNDLDWKGSTYIGECRFLEFPYAQNTLSFEFVALEYSNPAANRIQYRLKGFDPGWLEARPGVPGFARYAKLPPGEYVFQVMAFNSDGVLNPILQELTISILPPFWQRWWFIALCIALVFLIGYGFYRYRLAQWRREFDFQQKMTNSEMKALRAQMNPHFVFNSLNSINAYILLNKYETASSYLTRFAQLMRQILDNSARETISLEDEISFLESYLQAESMRLEEKLEYEIDVDEQIDQFETEIPSMILQPFVENAVWHGIAPKKSKGKITIRMQSQHNELLIRIEDDGIGRAKAAELRQVRTGSHTSKGLALTRERLTLFDQKHGTRSTVETTDLFDASGEPAGTRVDIRIGRPAV